VPGWLLDVNPICATMAEKGQPAAFSPSFAGVSALAVTPAADAAGLPA